MFRNCYSLTSINMHGSVFSNVADMSQLFSGCYSLKSLDLTDLHVSKVKYMPSMFSGCTNLTFIDLSNFDFSLVTSITYMFYRCISLKSIKCFKSENSSIIYMGNAFNGCTSLISIDLSQLIIPYVRSMENLFYNCVNITSVNLPYSNSSLLSNINSMFYGCSSLISIDFSPFNTSSIKNLGNLFNGCSSLKSVNFSNFNTSKVSNMTAMFYGCEKLISLNISDLETSMVETMDYMFAGCVLLRPLDFTKFVTLNVVNMGFMFANCTSLDSLDLSKFDTSSVVNMNYMFCNCTSLSSLDLSKFDTSSVVNMNYMFYGCNQLDYINCENCVTQKSLTISNIFGGIPENIVICLNTIIAKKIYQEIKNKYCYVIDCTENWKRNQKKLDPQNSSLCISESTIIEFFTDHNDNIKPVLTELPKDLSPTTNPNYNDNNNYDTNNYDYNPINILNCPKERPFRINTTNECLENCEIVEFQNQLCKLEYYDNETIKSVLIKIQEELANGNINTAKIIAGQNFMIKFNEQQYIITSSQYQNINENDTSLINLGECEDKLKQHYGIPLNDSLIILVISIYQEKFKIPLVDYIVYYIFNYTNLTQLDLNFCKGTKIEISFPFDINGDNIDKYNISSGYYNDICYSADSESGAYITISDRQKEYINNNLLPCEENCDFVNYDKIKKRAICSCDPKTSVEKMVDIKINTTKIYSMFSDFKTIFNLVIVKCHKILLNHLLNNFSTFIIIPIMLVILINIIVFIVYDYNNFITESKNSINYTIESTPDEIKDKKTIKKLTKNKVKKKRNNNDNIDIKTNINKGIKLNVVKKEETNNNPPIKRKDKKTTVKKSTMANIINNKFKNKSTNDKLNDFEINTLPYKEAMEYDKRSFFQINLSLLRMKHLLVFSFITRDDYNCKTVKISLFFINFAITLTVNALFFNDSTMHKIYEIKGNFDFVYQLPQILYSTLISTVLNMIIKAFALTQSDVLKLKDKKNHTSVKDIEDWVKMTKCKFIFFFVISELLLIFFWYYLGCFCAVYRDTQFHLIKDTLISFATSMIYPLFMNLIVSILRFASLKTNKEIKEWLYYSSKIVQLI